MKHRQRVLLALAQGEATCPQIRDRMQERHGKRWRWDALNRLFAPLLGPIYGTVRALERDGLVTCRKSYDDIAIRGGYPRYHWRLADHVLEVGP